MMNICDVCIPMYIHMWVYVCIYRLRRQAVLSLYQTYPRALVPVYLPANMSGHIPDARPSSVTPFPVIMMHPGYNTPHKTDSIMNSDASV